jgi:hypothetical protein
MNRITLCLPAVCLSMVAGASAQDATFDAFAEGLIGTTFTEGGITFSNLENDIGGPIGTNSFICEQADGSLAGQPGFTAPNCLGGATGYSPGPGAAYSRAKSYEMRTGQINTLGRLELWDGGIAGNTVSLEAYMGSTLVNSQTIVTQSAFGLHYTLTVSGVPFDMLRLQGNGPQQNGCLFVLVDGVHIGGTPAGTVICAGDGSGTACPCANNSPVGAGEGCVSSLGMGGKLRGTGVASLSADTAVLHGEQMPNAPCLYFQGTTPQAAGAGVVFGDGLRCAGGSIVRLGTKTNQSGDSEYPDNGDPLLSVRGQVTSPGLRVYQTWYRNAAPFCTAATFNLTNALSITWTP